MSTTTPPDDIDDLGRLARAIDTFSTLQRVSIRRVLPLQLFVLALQLAIAGALVYVMTRLNTLVAEQRRTSTATEQLVERPTIELRAESSSSATIVVSPPPTVSGAPSVELPVLIQRR